jgi:predicted nucleic acid-binding protein
LSAYLDSSVVVSMFVTDAHSQRVSAWLSRQPPGPVLSSWTLTEFSSALALRKRMGTLNSSQRLAAESGFDVWASSGGVRQVEVSDLDFRSARQLMRLDTVALRAADALHLAIAVRLGVSMATLDGELAAAANTLGLPLQPI